MLLIRIYCILFCFSMFVTATDGENHNFFQNDYDIVYHIADCSKYNKSIVTNVHVAFVPYNRTQRVLNASFELMVDTGADLMTDTQVYKMTSNEYRFFPLHFRANTCVEYNKNSFGTADLFRRTSNFTPCNMRKGVYYISNALPDPSRYPPHLPAGSYKVSLLYSFHEIFVMQFDFYTKVLSKMLKQHTTS